MENIDITIIGAGVVGLAIAKELSEGNKNVLVLEQHHSFGQETSSRNSEVIHAGIYYPKNSLKAKLCVEGKDLLYQYCEENGVPYKKVGKLIVATQENEEATLDSILEKAKANGVHDLEFWSQEKIQKKEPKVQATKALFSPSTGIVDTHQYMLSLLRTAEANGADFAFESKLEKVEITQDGFVLSVMDNDREVFEFQSRYLINAAGLHAQSVANKIQQFPKKEIPMLYRCKGNYFSMTGKNPFSHLVYPVPEKGVTGLGIHATLDLMGQLRFGPDTEYVDEEDYKVSMKNIEKYYKAIRRYFPDLEEGSLQEGYVGIRPKLQAPNSDFKDFYIQTEKEHSFQNLVQLFGIESPGLTASLAIAKYVQKQLSL
ncbi:MAG: L-2-hydroxyglutarate oxidase LhgO [bacterium]|jgi:L-2-hydroxyglutarate oxidase LhgO